MPTTKPSARRTKCRIANGWKRGSENRPVSSDYRSLPYSRSSLGVIKLVKPTKVVCSWAPHESGVRQYLLSQTKPHIRAAAAGILRKAYAAVRQKVCRLDAANCAFDQATKLLSLFL